MNLFVGYHVWFSRECAARATREEYLLAYCYQTAIYYQGRGRSGAVEYGITMA